MFDIAGFQLTHSQLGMRQVYVCTLNNAHTKMKMLQLEISEDKYLLPS